MATSPSSTSSRQAPRFAQWLHLVVLYSFSVAQPLLQVFRTSPSFFLTRRLTGIGIVMFAVAVALVIPTLLWLIVSLTARYSPRAGAIGQAVAIGLLAALLVVDLVHAPAIGDAVLLVVGTVAVGRLYASSATLRSFVTWGAIAPVAFVGSFLFTAPISQLLTSGETAKASVPVEASSPVIFMIFDEFPLNSIVDSSLEINKDRFPNLAKLATDSTWFRFAAPVSPYTNYSIPSIVSGARPSRDRVASVVAYPENLFTWLEPSYDLSNVREPITSLCAAAACAERTPSVSALNRIRDLAWVSSKVLAYRLAPDLMGNVGDGAADPFGEFVNAPQNESFASRVNAAIHSDAVTVFDEWLSEIDAGPRELNFGHFFLPHAPFNHLPGGLTYNGSRQIVEGLDDGVWTEEAWLPLHRRQRHLLQVKELDRLIGRLFDRLQSLDRYDDALIVLTSDHGVSFRPGHPRRDVDDTNKYDLGLVPLFVKAPGGEHAGRVIDDPVELVDILPTVASALGVELPWEVDGLSVWDGSPREDLHVGTWDGPVPLPRPRERLLAAVEELEETFGRYRGEFDLFDLGLASRLIGMRIEDLDVGDPVGEAKLDEPDLFLHVDASSGFVPALVDLEVSGLKWAADAQFAVTVNERVVTVVPSHSPRSGRFRVTAVVPGDSFVTGVNRIGVFAVTSSASDVMLQEISVERPDVYGMDSSGKVIVGPDGKTITVTDGAVLGFVDTAGADDQFLTLSGWAISPDVRRPVDRVVAFVAGQFITVAEPSADRSGIAEDYGAWALHSGYVLRLPRTVLRRASADDIALFGVIGNQASQLVVIESVQETPGYPK